MHILLLFDASPSPFLTSRGLFLKGPLPLGDLSLTLLLAPGILSLPLGDLLKLWSFFSGRADFTSSSSGRLRALEVRLLRGFLAVIAAALLQTQLCCTVLVCVLCFHRNGRVTLTTLSHVVRSNQVKRSLNFCKSAVTVTVCLWGFCRAT